MQEIGKAIEETYNIEVRNIVLNKGKYIVNSSSGSKILKKIQIPKSRLIFIHSAKEYLCHNGFLNIDRYLNSAEGNPFMEYNDDIYVLSDVIDGRECNFDDRQDVIDSARTLALLHKCSRGFKPSGECTYHYYLGKLPSYFKKRLDEIKKLKKIAARGKSKFDYMFLNCVDTFYNNGEDVIKRLQQSNYEEVVNKYMKEPILCHHDYAHHNIIFTPKGVAIINFEYCCFDLKVYDLANLIRRKMRKCNWNIDEAKVILHEYCSVEPIDDDEFLILKLMLQFPQKFWRIANKYYNSRRSWVETNYTYRLQEVVDEVDESKKLIDNFDNLR